MGGSSSKPDVQNIRAPEIDLSKVNVGLDYVQKLQTDASAALDEAKQVAETALSSNSTLSFWVKTLGGIIVFLIAGWAAYTYIWVPFLGPRAQSPVYHNLSIQTALTSAGNNVYDRVIDKVSPGSGEVDVLVDDNLGVFSGEVLNVAYRYTGQPSSSTSVKYGDRLIINPRVNLKNQSGAGVTSSNILPSAKDAKLLSTVPASQIPLPHGGSDYGYQFWMYVTDWNYRINQEKDILTRVDPTRPEIQNPRVFFDPVSNKLKIRVSVFPDSAAGKAEPAPAGFSDATDDVYTCTVDDIPINTWVAVGVSVASRQLDVYINGKMAASPQIIGVPRPAVGDILLNKDGGFEGWMCSFYGYSRRLDPSDAMSFYGSGKPTCSIPEDGKTGQTTFGFYDAQGNVVTRFMLG